MRMFWVDITNNPISTKLNFEYHESVLYILYSKYKDPWLIYKFISSALLGPHYVSATILPAGQFKAQLYFLIHCYFPDAYLQARPLSWASIPHGSQPTVYLTYMSHRHLNLYLHCWSSPPNVCIIQSFSVSVNIEYF